MLVWPWSREEASEPWSLALADPWDVLALRAFEGACVVHVGVLAQDQRGTATTSDAFKRELEEKFYLQEEVPIPEWVDQGAGKLTIWRRL